MTVLDDKLQSVNKTVVRWQSKYIHEQTKQDPSLQAYMHVCGPKLFALCAATPNQPPVSPYLNQLVPFEVGGATKWPNQPEFGSYSSISQNNTQFKSISAHENNWNATDKPLHCCHTNSPLCIVNHCGDERRKCFAMVERFWKKLRLSLRFVTQQWQSETPKTTLPQTFILI